MASLLKRLSNSLRRHSKTGNKTQHQTLEADKTLYKPITLDEHLYHPLNPDKLEIRLVKIKSAEPNEPVHLDLETYSLRNTLLICNEYR